MVLADESDDFNYYSQGLLYALISIGAKLDNDEEIASNANDFFDLSRQYIFNDLTSRIPTMQALICLAFFELGENNRSSAWLLSGIGIRMGMDIGFHLEPSKWFIKNSSMLTSHDINVRRRVFWGCYMADHFISFVLGRPSLLKTSSSTIADSEDLPKLNNIKQFEFVDSSVTFVVSIPLKYSVKYMSMAEYYFQRIYTNKTGIQIQELDKFNSQALNWRSQLPEGLSWNQKNLKYDKYNPVISGFRYNYYIILLLFNRPFLHFKEVKILSPKEICDDIVDELYLSVQRFSRDCTEDQSKVSFVLLYCLIIAISIYINLFKDKETLDEEYIIKLDTFIKVLDNSNWKLAKKSLRAAKKRITKLWRNAHSLKFLKDSINDDENTLIVLL